MGSGAYAPVIIRRSISLHTIQLPFNHKGMIPLILDTKGIIPLVNFLILFFFLKIFSIPNLFFNFSNLILKTFNTFNLNIAMGSGAYAPVIIRRSISLHTIQLPFNYHSITKE